MTEITNIPYTLNEWQDVTASLSLEDQLALWREIPEEINTEYFLNFDKTSRVNILLELTTTEQEMLIANLAHKDMKALLTDIPPDDLVDLFQTVSNEVRSSVWSNLTEETKKIATFLLRFDYDDAAGIMTPFYVKVRSDITVSQTISFIRAHIDEVETIYYIYIVDAVDRLQGVVSLRDLFRKQDDVLLRDFMITNLYSVHEDTDQEMVAETLQQHDLLAIPVIDNFNRLLGIVTVDDAIQVLNEEHDKDVLQLGAVSADSKKRPQSYLETNFFSMFKARIPWLAILLLASTLTANVINVFSNLLLSASYLYLFIPVIISTGGNTATQSSALMIRGLSRNEITGNGFKEMLKIILKEALIAFFLGISLACIMVIRGLIFAPSIGMLDIVVISTALVFVVLFSALIGVLAPLAISKLGADPTVIASPLIATVIDLVGLTIYFSIANTILTL